MPFYNPLSHKLRTTQHTKKIVSQNENTKKKDCNALTSNTAKKSINPKNKMHYIYFVATREPDADGFVVLDKLNENKTCILFKSYDKDATACPSTCILNRYTSKRNRYINFHFCFHRSGRPLWVSLALFSTNRANRASPRIVHTGHTGTRLHHHPPHLRVNVPFEFDFARRAE